MTPTDPECLISVDSVQPASPSRSCPGPNRSQLNGWSFRTSISAERRAWARAVRTSVTNVRVGLFCSLVPAPHPAVGRCLGRRRSPGCDPVVGTGTDRSDDRFMALGSEESRAAHFISFSPLTGPGRRDADSTSRAAASRSPRPTSRGSRRRTRARSPSRRRAGLRARRR